MDQYLALLQAQAHPNPIVRGGVAVALGRHFGLRAIDPLLTALNDNHPYVWGSAARALAAMGGPAPGALIDFLEDAPTSEVRRRAAEAIQSISDPSTIDLFTTALNHTEPDARFSAATALGNIGNLDSIPALINATRHPDPYTRLAACMALGKFGHPSGLEAVTSFLSEKDPFFRQEAAEALGAIGSARAFQPLYHALQDSDRGVRTAAAKAFIRMVSIEVIDAVIDMLNHPNAWMRLVAAESLGKLGDHQAIEPLHQLLSQDGDLEVRLKSAESLGRLGDEGGIRALHRMLRAPNYRTRILAGIALANTARPEAVRLLLAVCTEEHLLPTDPESPGLINRAAEALSVLGEDAIPALISTLSSRDPIQAQIAAEALLRIGPSVIESVVNALGTPSGESIALVTFLGRLGNPIAADTLAHLAVMANIERSLPLHILRVLVDPSRKLRTAAADSLAALPLTTLPDGVQEAALSEPDEIIQNHLMRAVAASGDVQGVLLLAAPPTPTFIHRGLVSLIFLVSGAVVLSVSLSNLGLPDFAPLAGLIAGGLLGFSGGFSGGYHPTRNYLRGIGVVLASTIILPQIIPITDAVKWVVLVGAVLLVGAASLWGGSQRPLVARLYGLFIGSVIGFLSAGAVVLFFI